jgi:hypothetical protein
LRSELTARDKAAGNASRHGKASFNPGRFQRVESSRPVLEQVM